MQFIGCIKHILAPSVSNLLSLPMKHNKFISSASSVSSLSIKPLNVSRPKGYQVYQEDSSVARSIRCIKVFQVYQMVQSVSKSIMVHLMYQGPKVIKRYQMYIKCIKDYQVQQGILGVSGVYQVYQVYQVYICNKASVIFYLLYMWVELSFGHFYKQ